jgi:hypothetical protein
VVVYYYLSLRNCTCFLLPKIKSTFSICKRVDVSSVDAEGLVERKDVSPVDTKPVDAEGLNPVDAEGLGLKEAEG